MGLGTLSELRVALLGVLLAAVLGWAVYEHHHLIAEGKALELATLKGSSDKLIAKAQQDIKDQTAQHEAAVAANEVRLNASLKTNTVLSNALDQRVRDFDTYRKSHPDLSCPASGPSTAAPGSPGPPALGDSAVQLAKSGNDLYRSNGELAASLRACEGDRDSLNGLPR